MIRIKNDVKQTDATSSLFAISSVSVYVMKQSVICHSCRRFHMEKYDDVT